MIGRGSRRFSRLLRARLPPPPLLHPDYLADVMVRYLEYVKDVMTASFYHISLSTETISHVEHEKKYCPVLKDRATDMQVP
jgi:hypothetical protein